MKQWRVYIIIIVLTSALIGLVMVQSIYIKRGLFIQEQVFNQIVTESIARAAMEIEHQEAVNFFNSPVSLSQFYGHTDDEEQVEDEVSLDFYNGIYFVEIQHGDTNLYFESDNIVSIDSMVQSHGLSINLLPQEGQFQDKMLEEFNMLFQNMAAQFMYSEPTCDLPVDSQDVVDILNFEFDRSGIDTKYEFAILDGYTLNSVISSFKNFSPKVLAQSYSTPIYLNSFYGNEAILLINFPKKRSFIMKSNRGLFLVSLLFIILIAVSFGASILVIFKQKKLSELKTDFINNMTHELKTPVATISLATEMLKNPKVLSDIDRVKNYTGIIGDENKRLGSHIEKVLQIAQLDRQKLKFKKENVDIDDLLDELMKKFELRIEAAQAEVVFKRDALNTICFIDKTHMLNVFSNLLDNSLKYRREEKLKIVIATYNDAKGLNISIKDNGLGMSNSNQKKIFTRFYRVPTGNVHNVKGFGLGLSYVKTMVDAHEGNISVDSELNKYTKFTITLPIV